MYVSLNGLRDSERDVTVLKMYQVIVSCELPKNWTIAEGFELVEISHPSYSLDLMLAAFFLFPKWKLPQGKKISGHQGQWEEYNLHNKYIPLDAFSYYVVQLIERYKECVVVKGYYFEGK